MKNNLKKVKEFFLTDVKKVNKFLLLIVILVILSGVGLTSFALFSYEVYSPVDIMLTYDDLKGPKCLIEGPSANEVNVNTNATYTMTCTDKAGVVEKDITSNDFVVEGDISIQSITKETVTNGFKYTINILSGTTDSVANIKFKENIIQDNNGNNNKESNVSNNITVKTRPEGDIIYWKGDNSFKYGENTAPTTQYVYNIARRNFTSNYVYVYGPKQSNSGDSGIYLYPGDNFANYNYLQIIYKPISGEGNIGVAYFNSYSSENVAKWTAASSTYKSKVIAKANYIASNSFKGYIRVEIDYNGGGCNIAFIGFVNTPITGYENWE